MLRKSRAPQAQEFEFPDWALKYRRSLVRNDKLSYANAKVRESGINVASFATVGWEQKFQDAMAARKKQGMAPHRDTLARHAVLFLHRNDPALADLLKNKSGKTFHRTGRLMNAIRAKEKKMTFAEKQQHVKKYLGFVRSRLAIPLLKAEAEKRMILRVKYEMHGKNYANNRFLRIYHVIQRHYGRERDRYAIRLYSKLPLETQLGLGRSMEAIKKSAQKLRRLNGERRLGKTTGKTKFLESAWETLRKYHQYPDGSVAFSKNPSIVSPVLNQMWEDMPSREKRKWFDLALADTTQGMFPLIPAGLDSSNQTKTKAAKTSMKSSGQHSSGRLRNRPMDLLFE